ncbi:MAG TPA: hypothetical protein VNC17_18410 [Thermoleophilaceae bacterium]|nr:hypothetical protein [Thermoleophilaceae bacterium]
MGLLDDAIREHLELKRKHGAAEDELQRQEEEALGPARREVAPTQPQDGNGAGERPEPASETPSEVASTEAPEAATGEQPATETPSETALEEPQAEITETGVPETRDAVRPAHAEPQAPYDEAVSEREHSETAPELEREPAPELEREPAPELEREQPEPASEPPPEREREPAPDPEPTPFASAQAEPVVDSPEHEEPAAPAGDIPPAGDTPPRGFDALDEDDRELLEEEEAAPDDEADEDLLVDTPDFLQETPEHDRLWFEQKPPRDFDFD